MRCATIRTSQADVAVRLTPPAHSATAVLTIISLTIFLAERHFRFPVWLPYAASFPVAWALTLPSALELGGALSMWLVFGTVVAGVFCLHWQVFTWARTIWD